MANTNGKTNPKLVEAQQRVAVAEKELRASQSLLTQQQTKLSEAEQVMAHLADMRREAEGDIVDEKPGAVARIRQLDTDLSVAAARVNGLKTKLALMRPQIDALSAAHQQAAVALAGLMQDVQIAEAEEELSKARWHQAQAEEALTQAQKRTNEVHDRFRLLSQQKRDAQQAETQRASREKFLRDNPNNHPPARTHVRQGF